MGGLQANERLQLPDRPLALGEDLKDPDPGRVRESAEEVGLDLGQRATRVGARCGIGRR